MYHWQVNICEGNLAFELNHYSKAIKFYEQCLQQLALIEKEIYSNSAPPSAWIIDQYLPALIVSYLNIIDSHLADKHIEKACNLLEKGYEKARICTDTCLKKSDMQLRNVALRHLSQLKQYAFMLAKQVSQQPVLLAKLKTITNTQTILNNTIH
ncbi:hypothetical protein AAEU29_11640 [Pseudoalteromonas sp. SSM20]|uniref:hypothetical protein n=1 Tax=unclassified Pseudoalteromonas TaxID=194690 RepID=UPI00237DE0C2|nr:hypothetical protein [Pseudoalteromonas sp. G4]MDE3270411.1 hypothetical protein [Pseudoalteromonas sp. G4]